MKKVLSLVLVIAMVLSSMSFAFASTFEDVTGDYEDAVNALVALGVINGYEDGTFRPENSLKRAELAKLLVEALGYGNLVGGAAGSFSDTEGHWAEGYIAIAAGTGLVNGYPDGTFKPEQTLTYDEVFAMVIRSLGYTEASLKGNWPTNYKVKAIDLGLDDDVVLGTGADRGGVAQVLFNALEAELVEINADNEVVKVVRDGKVKILIDNIATLDDNYTVNASKLNKNAKEYGGDIIDLTPYYFQNLEVYKNSDKEVVYIKDTNSLVVEGKIDEVKVDGEDIIVAIEKEDGTIEKVTFEASTTSAISATKVFENGDLRNTGKLYVDLENTESIKIVANDKDENGKIDTDENEVTGFVVTEQTGAKVIEKAYVSGKDKIDSFDLPTNSNDKVDFDKITVTGAVDSLEDIKIDDVVVEYAAEDGSATKLVVSRNTVEGKITREDRSKDAFYIDGTRYEVNTIAGVIGTEDLALGDEGTFYLDHNNQIVDFDGESSGPSNYAVVIGKEAGKIDEKFGKTSIDDYAQLKLATQEDEEVVYDIYAKISTSGSAVTAVTAGPKDADGNYYVQNNLSISGIPTNALIKYSLNSDGKISKITVVGTEELDNVDTTKSSFKFASNALVFDADDDYAVVNKDRVADDVTGLAVYNKHGEVEVLITGDVKAGSVSTFAYVSKVVKAYDSSDDEVQFVTLYMNGEKIEAYTDEADMLVANGVYEIEFDGDVITEVTEISDVEDYDETLEGVLVDSVSTRTNSLVVGDTRYFLAEDATILEKDGSTYSVVDLLDVDGETADIYLVDGEVVYVFYTK